MILPRLLAKYEADKRTPKGNPTGSRFGTCAAQMQMLRWPELTHPTPYPARALITFEEGHRTEAWLADKMAEEFPSDWGLRQATFYLRVPLVADVHDALCRKMDAALIWGKRWTKKRFTPPTVVRNKRGRLHLKAPRGVTVKTGFILDHEALWAPVTVDGIVNHPDAGLTVVEFKSMSTPRFRRAIVGDVGYEMQAQLAGMAEASGLNAMWLCYRKETGHLAEILYTKDAQGITVQLRAPGGRESIWYTGPTPPDEEPLDAEYEAAAVWTPWQPGLLDEIRYRILLTLLAGPHTEWCREYGPTFTCGKCNHGERVCRTCKGSGVTAKLGKPCGPCAGEGSVRCGECDGYGNLEEAELPWQCSYCPVTMTCWGPAGVTLSVDTRPHYRIRHEDFLASNITFGRIGEEAQRDPRDGP